MFWNLTARFHKSLQLLKVWGLPCGPVVKTSSAMLGVWVQSLVGELRSYMPKKQDIKQRQGSNEHNKGFKNSLC